MASDQEPTDQQAGVVTVRVEIIGLDEIPPQFVNLVHANTDGQVIQIVFSQLMPPIIMGSEDWDRRTERGWRRKDPFRLKPLHG